MSVSSVKRIVLGLVLSQCLSTVAHAEDTNHDGLERVLIPLGFYSSAQMQSGAFGSVFAGYTAVYNGNPFTIPVGSCMPVSCAFYSPFSFDSIGRLVTRPDLGIAIDYQVIASAKMTFSSRLFERSRRGQPRGIDLPVVREGHFFDEAVGFPNVPFGPDVRVSLRVYDPWQGHPPASPMLEQLDVEYLGGVLGDTLLAQSTLHPRQPFTDIHDRDYSLYYPSSDAIHDVRSFVPELQSQSLVHIRITPRPAGAQFYAMVSVTDNETQTVSIITSH